MSAVPTLTDGDPAPSDGSLPEASAAAVGARPLGMYVHVPFCAVRCGYCDFNTYTATELGGADGPAGSSQASFAEGALRVLSGEETAKRYGEYTGGTKR